EGDGFRAAGANGTALTSGRGAEQRGRRRPVGQHRQQVGRPVGAVRRDPGRRRGQGHEQVGRRRMAGGGVRAAVAVQPQRQHVQLRYGQQPRLVGLRHRLGLTQRQLGGGDVGTLEEAGERPAVGGEHGVRRGDRVLARADQEAPAGQACRGPAPGGDPVQDVHGQGQLGREGAWGAAAGGSAGLPDRGGGGERAQDRTAGGGVGGTQGGGGRGAEGRGGGWGGAL